MPRCRLGNEAMEATALLVSATSLVVVDQLTKAWVTWWLPQARTASFGGVRIRGVVNQRVRVRSSRGAAAMVGFWVAEIVILVSIVHLGPFFQGVVAPVALGAAVGGAGSNLVDRLWRAGVVDFIDIGFWPVFNVADVAIVVGGVIAAFHI
jgi:signal peptidase II